MGEKVEVADAVPVENNPLLQMRGVAIRQETQLDEWLVQNCVPGGCCCEFNNVYKIGAIPEGRNALSDFGEGWSPSNSELEDLAKPYEAKEDSSCIIRGILAFFRFQYARPFKMLLRDPQNETFMRIDKGFTVGGMLCCCLCPHSATVSVEGQEVGRVLQDWNCENWLCRLVECYFCWRCHYKLQRNNGGVFEDKYNINVNFSCCGPHCNFLRGFYPCCPDVLWDVVPEDGSGGVGKLQQSCGGCSCGACLRIVCCNATNFVTEWPANAPLEDRALQIGAAILLDYALYSNPVCY